MSKILDLNNNTHCTTDIPFARMDAILLLAKNHLRGEIPTILNTKDNQVFLDYLAGGQNQRIAVERAANAQSDGILSMGARNVQGIPEGSTIQDLLQAVESIAAKMEKIKKDCMEYTILAKRLHEQAMGFEEDRANFIHDAKKRLIDMKAEAHERIVQTEKRRIDYEMRAEEQKIDMKKLVIELTVQEAEAITKRAQAVKALAEATADLKAVQTIPRTEYDEGLTTDSDEDDEVTPERSAYYDHLLSLCKIPVTVDELQSLFAKGPSAALNEELNSLRKQEYEACMLGRLQKFSDAASKHARDKLNESLKRVEHYCHLVFWKLAERYLSEDARAEIMGSFNPNHETPFSSLTTTWCNVDEKLFGLPVDDTNIPAAVAVDKKLLEAAQRWVGFDIDIYYLVC
jgi:hypothetical protein